MRVLLVDDDPLIRTVAKALLAKAGCEVALAASGLEALVYVASAPDLVLMDCQMPELDGWTTVREWRQRENGHCPIIGLSGGTEPDDRERAMDAGMDDFLSKPVTRDKIGYVLERWGSAATPAGAELDGAGAPITTEPIRPELLDEYRGFEGVLGSMIQVFLEALEQEQAELEADVHQGNAAGVLQGAHKLKGQLLSFQQSAAAEAATALESAASLGEVDRLSTLWADLRDQLPAVRRRLAVIQDSLA